MAEEKEPEKIIGLVWVLLTMIVTYSVYVYFGSEIKTENYLDIFTSGIFFTAMWFMANKKLENWIFWVVGNLVSIPLYFVKGYGFTGIQYTIFLVIAILGYHSWKKRLNKQKQIL